MKFVIAGLVFCLLPLQVFSQQSTIIDQSTVYPSPGPGSWIEVKCRVPHKTKMHLVFSARKTLARVTIILYPGKEIAHINSIKKGTIDFEAPYSGEVTIRFTNDRVGRNSIKYQVIQEQATTTL